MCIRDRPCSIASSDASSRLRTQPVTPSARALGVTGWVRNRMDASVEAMLQGSPMQLEAMCAWLDEGMPAALVEGMEVIEVPAPFPRFDRFEQLPTL
uniref:acylphosphatase n=1 Tax=Ralstonia solanacearum TaxID=305 RepID=A0A0S4TP46_RALSL|nr:putative Acylphosphatase [Ralstonia solanacearum]